MSEPIVYPSLDGVEVQLGDVANLGAVAGLADDRVLAEVLRLAPYDGTNVYKCVLPYSTTVPTIGGPPTAAPVVQPSGAPDGKVTINPFRAIIGSRNAPTAAPSPNVAVNYQTDQMANWRDIRSAVYTSSGATISGALSFAINSSGNPRWDLVYATVAVDVQGPSVTRRVKDPSSGALSATSVYQFLNSTIAIGVVQGTPGATPVEPSIPADASGNYNVPLCWVRIPNGYATTSSIAAGDIRSCNIGPGAIATGHPLSRFAAPHSLRIRPASGNNDDAGTYSGKFPWVGSSSGVRPGPFLPPDFVGGEQVFLELDYMTGGAYSHTSGSVADNAIDWRNRLGIYFAQVSPSKKFANDTTGSTDRVPGVNGGGPPTIWNWNSMAGDNVVVAGASTVLYLTNGINTSIASGAAVGLYVDPSTGHLLAWDNGTLPACRIFVWLMATAQFPNYA